MHGRLEFERAMGWVCLIASTVFILTVTVS